MTIYFLRHEERPLDDSTFLVELTDLGKERANTSLKEKLLSLNVTVVYCSPFIRCQQTIAPFVEASHNLVRVENCLQEVYGDPKFIEKPLAELSVEEKALYCVDPNYVSIMPPNTLSYPEPESSVKERVAKFCQTLPSNDTDIGSDNVLVCSHMSTVNHCLATLYHLPRDNSTYYPMGAISTISSTDSTQLIFL